MGYDQSGFDSGSVLPAPALVKFGELPSDRRAAATVQYAELAWANDLAALNSVLVVTDFLPR